MHLTCFVCLPFLLFCSLIVDWALLSDSSATTLSTKLLSQSQLLTAYGPQTPVSIDYTSREMVESILVPTENGGSSQTFTLTMSFRVNELCCPNGLSGTFEVHDESGVMTSAMSLLLAQGQFSNAQQAMATFTLTAINTAQSSATTIRRRRRRILGARVLPWMVVWTSLLVVVVIPMLLL
jgi:hypothetical protein